MCGELAQKLTLRRIVVAFMPLLALIGMIVVGVATGSEAIDRLVSTRGMSGMLTTVWLILCAVSFGGVMYAGGDHQ